MRNAIRVGVACCALLASVPVHAEATASEFIRLIDGQRPDRVWENVLYSIHLGFFWANGQLEVRGDRPLYCIPPKMIMEREQVTSIFRNYVSSHPNDANTPAGAVLLWALSDTFPCPRKANGTP